MPSDAKRRIDLRRAVASNGDLVALNGDLVELMLHHALTDVSTYVAASRVCRLWHDICASNEALLRLVALSQNALTRTVFRGLFALTGAEAAAYAHSRHRSLSGYTYYLYRKPAIEAVLRDGGIAAVRKRRQELPAWPYSKPPSPSVYEWRHVARRVTGPWDAF